MAAARRSSPARTACAGTGASWNRPQCTTGAWPAPAAGSASANSPAAIDQPVAFTGGTMNADIQGWIDTPASNNGWLITSSTEGGTMGQAQRFYSRESGTTPPSLQITYSCKAGFVEAGNTCAVPTLDIDGNGSYDALTDGLLVIRYVFGLRGSALIAGAIGGPMPSRPASADVEQYLASFGAALDVDANGQVDALTDGLIVIRYLFGLRGATLTANAVGSNAMRSPAQIETYVQSLMP